MLGTKLLGWRAVGYVERDAYCQQVLVARIRDGLLDSAPIFGDIQEFLEGGAAESYRGIADVVTAGFPCPVFSQAARGRNVADNLWPETAQVIRLVRPRLCLLENVEAIRNVNRGLAEVLADLATLGYDARWDRVSAGAIGAPHYRPRLWILASDTHGNGEPSRTLNAEASWLPRLEWPSRPGELRVGNGLAHRVDRLRAIGNGQVPAVVRAAWHLLGGN